MITFKRTHSARSIGRSTFQTLCHGFVICLRCCHHEPLGSSTGSDKLSDATQDRFALVRWPADVTLPTPVASTYLFHLYLSSEFQHATVSNASTTPSKGFDRAFVIGSLSVAWIAPPLRSCRKALTWTLQHCRPESHSGYFESPAASHKASPTADPLVEAPELPPQSSCQRLRA